MAAPNIHARLQGKGREALDAWQKNCLHLPGEVAGCTF